MIHILVRSLSTALGRRDRTLNSQDFTFATNLLTAPEGRQQRPNILPDRKVLQMIQIVEILGYDLKPNALLCACRWSGDQTEEAALFNFFFDADHNFLITSQDHSTCLISTKGSCRLQRIGNLPLEKRRHSINEL
jgi:hypothetical protein